MTDDRRITKAHAATDERFLSVVLDDGTDHPEGSEFVRADLPGLASVLARNVAEQRATVIVHDDGSEVVVEPPDLRGFVLLGWLVVGWLLGSRGRPSVQAEGEVVELPVGSRVRLRSGSSLAA